MGGVGGGGNGRCGCVVHIGHENSRERGKEGKGGGGTINMYATNALRNLDHLSMKAHSTLLGTNLMGVI